MSEIVLVRHGEPALKGVILGSTDPCLSAEGFRQAQLAADAVAGLPASSVPAVVYCSPLRRAQQTAAFLVRPWRPMVVLHDLREISYGEWDGLPWESIERMHPALARQKADDWLNVTVPGGETWAAFSQRVDHALELIRRGPLPAVVVAHQGVNAQIAHRLTGALQTDFRQSYCEILSYASHTD